MAVRALIVDDSTRFLEAVGSLFEREGEITVVGLASTGAEALPLAQALRPDIILVDIKLRGESGFEVARLLSANVNGGSNVILISTHAESDFADLIESSPAIGFVSKSELSTKAILDVVQRGRSGTG